MAAAWDEVVVAATTGLQFGLGISIEGVHSIIRDLT